MSEGVEQIVEQRGHWRKVIEMGDVISDLVCYECILCGFTITSAHGIYRRLDTMYEEIQRVLRAIEDHDQSDHTDQFETMSHADFVQALDMRAMDINFHFALDAFTWPDRSWGEITHAGRKSLRVPGEVSQ